MLGIENSDYMPVTSKQSSHQNDDMYTMFDCNQNWSVYIVIKHSTYDNKILVFTKFTFDQG